MRGLGALRVWAGEWFVERLFVRLLFSICRSSCRLNAFFYHLAGCKGLVLVGRGIGSWT